jgi:hypothetical protein
MRKHKAIFWTHIGFKGPYFDPVPYLNKNHVNTSGPNKKIVLICWGAVAIAAIVLVVKIIIGN